MKKCSFDDCSNVVLARGWCRTHYLRWYKHGDAAHVTDLKAIAKRGSDLPQTTHGMWSHPLYPTWHTMMSRCYKADNHKYPRYGARGITVCARWHDVANFVSDMGERPAGHSLDRFDNDKAYSPENCRWATAVQQARNRPQAKLSDLQRERAISLYAESRSPKKVAEILGIRPGDVKNIVYGDKKRAMQRL